VIPDNFPLGSQQSLTLRVRFTFESGEPYPGRGRRVDEPLATNSALYPGQIKPSDLPARPRLLTFMFVGVLHANKAFNPNLQVEGPSDEFGYQAYHRIGKEATVYRLPADRRLGHATRAVDIPCSDSADAVCSVSVGSSDGFVSLGLRWLGPSPRADWSLYDAAARKISDSIFVGRKPGDIQ
jgi:hypothetical protein